MTCVPSPGSLRRLIGLVALAVGLLVPWTTDAQDASVAPPLPLVDTHVHYNRETWAVYAPEEVLALLEQAGVRRALVSSTPDDGTLLLYHLAPDRVVPVLRPYRTNRDFATWTRDLTIVDYVQERLDSGVPYRGIGELELAPGQASDPVPRRLAEIAAERGLWLHVHAGGLALSELAGLNPGVPVLWAHAGVTDSAETVGRVLDDHPNVWVELSLRSADVAPDGWLDPGWAALFERHPERVMVGSDTWLPASWTALPRIHAEVQGWLRQLPPHVAELIAWGNAERLFGVE